MLQQVNNVILLILCLSHLGTFFLVNFLPLNNHLRTLTKLHIGFETLHNINQFCLNVRSQFSAVRVQFVEEVNSKNT